jgi:nucleotide-binding universal stress UspA family protein
MLPLRTILHPTDFSEAAGHAFHLAASLARDHGARLVLLHVVAPASLAEEMSFLAPTDDPHEKIWEAFQGLETSEPRIGQFEVRSLVEVGPPVATILSTAKALNCDLIVMGTHGRAGLGHLLMGSIAEKVLRKAPCPVLTVKVPLGPEHLPKEPGRTGKTRCEEPVMTR